MEEIKLDEIKVIRVALPDHDKIELFPLGDVHWEEPETDEVYFGKLIDYILSEPYRYIVLNGDLLNMALTMSVSDTYGEKYSPEDGLIRFANVLKRAKHRILAMGTGNHEDRVYKYTGLDVSRYLAMELGLDLERYSNNSFVLFVKFGVARSSTVNRPKKNVYSGFFHHGVGGGRMKGGKVNMVVRMAEIVDTDFYVVNHVHDPILTSTRTFNVDIQNMALKEKKQYYVVANAWQKYGGYGQKFGFRPSPLDITYIELTGNGSKKIKLHLGV